LGKHVPKTPEFFGTVRQPNGVICPRHFLDTMLTCDRIPRQEGGVT
jgi:hypothetical protein